MFRELCSLYAVFFKIGAVTFGGGYAMLPILERELVQKRAWARSEDLLDYYAVSQVTPGVIAVNVATFVGCARRGIPGGLFATAGVVTPSLIIITLVARFISSFEDIVWVQKAMSGINVAVAALLTFAAVNFARRSIKKWWGVLFYAASFAAVYVFRVPSVAVVLAAAIGGVAVSAFVERHKKSFTEGKK
ncbi:MAG: chromate transporter [Treponema sp.]|nr:chromate transporter [Treponema sp.]